ncbi:ATP-dependent helicase HepA [Actinomadura rubteroloni]|uniref:ATP-dependent helicase HepA n=1 Tax=Actinomadura rubteroloni TaxID=1926885 RepID=A0A2P4UFC3_9ACTN|nr:DEAD/DEAH box helicase [Actinomadura rubteroloni]POM23753.1 ATP-dependent helicase HepA [Actinomadura rubteroloni]
MERHERQQLRSITDEVAGWVGQARTVLAHRDEIARAADDAIESLRRAVVALRRDEAVDWAVMPLRTGDGQLLGRVAERVHQPSLAPAEDRTLRHLTTQVAGALHDTKSVAGARRFFSGRAKRDAGQAAASFVLDFRTWGVSSGVPQLLDRLSLHDGRTFDVGVADALGDWVGFRKRIADLGDAPEVISSAAVTDLPASIGTIEKALRDEARYRAAAVSAGEAVRSREVQRMLVEMPVERLKDATRDRLRIGPLADAGITTVQAVLDYGARLEYLPGVGATTATRMRGAAQTLWQMTYDEMPVRIDIKQRTDETTELLRRLGAWDAMRKTKGATTDLTLAGALAPLARVLHRDVSHLIVFAVGAQVAELGKAVEAVRRRARSIDGTSGTAASADPWDDFLGRPADYFAMLSELGFLTEDEQKTHGDLPDDIIEAVRRLQLDTEYLSASLRGYQSFGARFALAQRNVIIGDEMGLGKTVEALAVLAHLRANGGHYSVVVCPAAVVTNWVREISSKSSLRPHRVHGPGREAAARNWVRSGGVAVTTFETLGWFENHARAVDGLACAVVDEAHYIKNPTALRTRRTRQLLDAAERSILLTGTPLENRIDEFRNLVSYLRPDLIVDADEFSPRRFRRQVAPAYLRRNQEDVLTELPELVEVEEWLPLSREDSAAYRNAVAAGNFMAMRQAAMLQGAKSEKVRRLVEIVEEAEDNGRRVVVFSHFREVLDHVVRALPRDVFGPLTGSVPAAARQTMVDQFSAAGDGAVLVSQIVAGGVGLNIQAASVVVICEPQLKPTTEWQAVARAHRMGQLESVQVHRLLSEEGADLRVTKILARKRELFENFARVSETADSAPEAFDVSEAELAREVIAAERERLFSQDAANLPEGEEAV